MAREAGSSHLPERDMGGGSTQDMTHGQGAAGVGQAVRRAGDVNEDEDGNEDGDEDADGDGKMGMERGDGALPTPRGHAWRRCRRRSLPGRGGGSLKAAAAARRGTAEVRTEGGRWRRGAGPGRAVEVAARRRRMLKSCGRKLLLSLVGSMFTCLLVLMVEPPGRPGLARGEAGGAQRALQSLGAARPAGQGAPGLRSFADYFGRLSRARRELPAAPPSPPRPPAEDISPRDVFIAVKTTKKFHKARLELLLDTWISRNRDMVRSRPAGASGSAPLPASSLRAPPGYRGVPRSGWWLSGRGEMRVGFGKWERREELGRPSLSGQTQKALSSRGGFFSLSCFPLGKLRHGAGPFPPISFPHLPRAVPGAGQHWGLRLQPSLPGTPPSARADTFAVLQVLEPNLQEREKKAFP